LTVFDEDLEIVDRVLEGNADAFDELVLKYQRQIAALVIRMNGYHDDVSDTIQLIFVKAFRKLRSFRRKSTFKTWLYAIGMNTCRNDLRRIVRSRKEEDVDEAGLAHEPRVEKDMLKQQRRAKMLKAMEQVPPRQRETISLRIYEEMSFREIAAVLGTTENTAKVNFHHGMKRLKELVSDY